ncbi:MAG: UDP-N-acetylglucosamine 1-carboxyvinyltransferase [Phycisphaerales bacterium]|nr:UDP-N-acetylglucosamine 1-carboxyvinyltransferase [Planctomycetota bacterium]MCH8509589.1 UDP-N-acetylglucosamine 1-carboxyvinyltransferase [Phycisphaerales bacterium]
MDAFVIEGGRRLEGRLRINGSKNSALPIMAAVLLTDEPVTLRDVPDLSDIRNMVRLLGELGVMIARETDNRGQPVFALHAIDQSPSHARYEIVRTMRASICVLGPMLARRGKARVSLPGGCAIGQRPVDLHLRGLEALGARITLDGGDIVAEAPGGRLRGATLFLGGANGSTVLGTANVMSAATLARGTTVIECAACEPEIVDLANMLNAMGARIEGAGSPRITVRGVESLGGVDHAVIPDRIEAGTLMCAAAITEGDLTLDNCPLDALMAATDTLGAIGVAVDPIGSGDDPMRRTCRVTRPGGLRPAQITTQPHPGFPTDLQAQFMALLCLAQGNSVITEKIFPDRFLHVAELQRMGASLIRQNATVVATGVPGLTGAPVMASDLRASAGLVIAGLAARGETTINRVYHIDRGYEKLEDRLASVGASIRRQDIPAEPVAAG